MPPNPGEMRNLRCYVLRYPDLLSGFCQGSLALCDWNKIGAHFDKAGVTEGRYGVCKADDMMCYALRHKDLLESKCKGQLATCDWEALLQHWSEQGKKIGKRDQERTIECGGDDVKCYAERYDDLKPYCKGEKGCSWARLREHWHLAGKKEGRIWGCDKPPSPPSPPPPYPSPSPAPPLPPDCLPARLNLTKVRIGGGAAGPGFEMALPPGGDGVDKIAGFIRREGYYEIRSPAEMGDAVGAKVPTAIPGNLRHGHRPRMLDIGANFGFYTLLFASHGYHVFAVEPMESNRLAMEASLCLNPHLTKRVVILGAALGSPEEKDETCTVRPQTDDTPSNGALTCGADSKPCHRKTEPYCQDVMPITLDEMLKEVDPGAIDVVKMDLAGHECAAMAGGLSLFSQYRPTLIQWHSTMARTDACMRILAQMNAYTVGSPRKRGSSVLTAAALTSSLARAAAANASAATDGPSDK